MNMSYELAPTSSASSVTNVQVILIQILVLIALVACSTRFMTGWKYQSDLSTNEAIRKPATIPYWIPYLGHLLPLAINPSRFLQKCRCVFLPWVL